MSAPPSSQSLVLSYAHPQRSWWQRMGGMLLFWSWICPLLPIISLYATWLVAWMMLGHRPIPSIDDPKYIGTLVDLAYLLTAVLLIASPVLMLVGLAGGILLMPWWVSSRSGNAVTGVILIILLLALYAGCFALLRWDPLHVLYWYMD